MQDPEEFIQTIRTPCPVQFVPFVCQAPPWTSPVWAEVSAWLYDEIEAERVAQALPGTAFAVSGRR